MEEWVEGLMNYPGIVFLMALENIFPPIPSELIMPLAGYRAAQDELNLYLAIVCGVIGALIGQVALFYLGKKVGADRLKEWAEKHGEWVALRPEDIDNVNDWFDKHGHLAVLWGRMVPGFRSLVSIPAGFADMNFGQFLLYSAIGTTGWTALLAWLGNFLGERYDQIGQYVSIITYVVLGGTFLYFIYQVIKRKKEKKEKGNEESGRSGSSGKQQESAT
ncbi:MAG: DedA family protein [Armatimonadaceae bacterium]